MSAADSTACAVGVPATVADGPRRTITAHFVPRWPTNPYHGELARHLAAQGVVVADENRLKAIASASRPSDIVHLHALPAFSLRPRRLARFVAFWIRLRRLRRQGVKFVWTVHNLADHESPHPSIDRLFLRHCYRRADSVILHSPGARRLVETQWRVHRERGVFIVHHGHFIDSYPPAPDRGTARRRIGVAEDELVFLFLGGIRPYKGVPELVRAFKTLSRPGLRLVIAGQPLSDRLREAVAREIADDPAITFHPWFVADADLPAYFGAADAVVFPYTKTLTSGALILAMSYGRACIAPAVGALGDTLDERGGFLFSPDAPDALRTALLAAVGQRADLAAMGEYNLARVRGWDWDTAAARTAATYQACLNDFR